MSKARGQAVARLSLRSTVISWDVERGPESLCVCEPKRDVMQSVEHAKGEHLALHHAAIRDAMCTGRSERQYSHLTDAKWMA